jgi:CheY-like chemotaxis protein
MKRDHLKQARTNSLGPRLKMMDGKVLVVDDNDLVRTCLAEFLIDSEIDVMVAASGPEAVGLWMNSHQRW